jgi:GAG-pre-integrase domain
LFSSLKPINRRTIQVGGGHLYAQSKGTIELKIGQGSALLKDVLFVPNLGVSLLSARKVCKKGLQGSFDQDKMLFLNKEGKTIIQAKLDNGLYIVDSIAKGYSERAFPSTIQISSKLKPKTKAKSTSKVQSKAKNLERYSLFHRRFGHLGPGKLKHLHECTTLEDRVVIPEKRDICEVCKLTKIRNKKPK